LKSVLKFILSHSIFVSFCAFGLTFQTYILSIKPINQSVCWLVFFSTIGAYNLYWILSKWSYNKNAPVLFSNYKIHFILLISSFLVVVDYLWQIPSLIPTVLISIGLTLFYTIIVLPIFKNVSEKLNGLLKTFTLASTWTFVTVVIPLHDQLYRHGFWVLISTRFLFLLMLCIIFDARDSKMDLWLKMDTSVSKINSKVLSVLMFIIIMVNGVLLFLFGIVFQDQYQVFVLMCSSALAFLLYLLSFKKRGYFFYYFMVDGMMLLSSFASYMLTI
jgi:hypothetical protein